MRKNHFLFIMLHIHRAVSPSQHHTRRFNMASSLEIESNILITLQWVCKRNLSVVYSLRGEREIEKSKWFVFQLCINFKLIIIWISICISILHFIEELYTVADLVKDGEREIWRKRECGFYGIIGSFLVCLPIKICNRKNSLQPIKAKNRIITIIP